ncbi:sugar ABC transporter permease [Psychrobacillus sp. AK 1817]|uniref:Sugar ABC transporter permease n=1 Tax=Psychrobacillus faecigallinarum TaxID=2762235 RepID=A0ABR8RBH1_9BACI|nr:ABC transporter permease subunit [Psychrobacillus sp. AK 1817]MBD7945131.1 sugar ABC transporter permease [Psychrobacillus faecigallinarum]QEY22897.1 sugar ABC transporter permease [Psychrobacillus sp. AK 1817]QGM32584.1 ABC transporter permease subunit [Bacillus sp. N3536]
MKQKLWRDRYLLLLLLPGALYFLIYRYIPMVGILLAFKDYSPFIGFIDSPWVGLKYFRLIFEDAEVVQVIWNTLQISLLQIVFAFPISIILALMLNELRNQLYKRFLQSIVYMPHFLSWVVVVGITVIFLRSEGLVNNFLGTFLDINPIPFLTDPAMFKPIVILQVIWKESGWGTILFLAALSGISPHLYEAAVMDGASRMRQIWHITLPALKSTIVILLILRLGNVMDSGFEQIFLMLNPFNMESGNVLDTYVYFKGIQQANFSFATAVGLFKGIIGLILVVLANRLAKRFGEEGLY